jgi:hypothetical protein
MRVQFVLSWLALLLVPVGFYIESNYLIWFSAIIATIFIIKIGISPCKKCGERTHLYMRGGVFAKFKVGFPLGRCDHCGESYIKK